MYYLLVHINVQLLTAAILSGVHRHNRKSTLPCKQDSSF